MSVLTSMIANICDRKTGAAERQLLPCILVLVAFALRAAALDRQSFWGDEGHSVYLAGLPLDQIGTGLYADQVPLYFLLLRGWTLLVGESEYAIRFLSLLYGVISVALIYLLSRRVSGQRVALLAMAVAAVSPLYVWYSQDARPYTLLVLLALVMLLALDCATASPRAVAPWAVYVASATSAAYTHYSIVPAVILWPPLMLFLARRRNDAPWSIRERLTRMLPAALAIAIVALAMVPWLWRQAQQVKGLAEVSAGALSLPVVLSSTAMVFTLGNSVAKVDVDMSLSDNLADYRLALVLTMPVLLLALLGLFGSQGRRRNGLMVAALLFVPIVAMYLYALGHHDVHPRYFIATSPAWMMLVAAGLAELLRRRWMILLAGGAVVAVSGFALFAYYTDQRFARDDWRSAVRYILSHERSNDAIVVDGPYTEPIVDYYHKDGAATIYRLTDKGPPTPEEIRTLLSELSGKHRTIWLLFWQAFYNDPQHVAAEWLDSHGALMDQQGFRGVSLLRRYSTTPVVLKADVSPSRLVGVTLEDKVGLLGYDLDESDVAELSQLYVTIYWQVLRPVDANLRVFVHLINSAYTAWGIADGRPGYYRFPTDRWQPGTIIRDEYTVPVLSGTPPGDYRLDVGMYDEATGQRLRTSDPNGDHLVLGPVTIPRQQIQPRPANTTGVTFGDHIELLGYETAAAIPPGGTLPVMLFWRANGPVEQDYKVFVHLTDRSGRPLAQSDSQPADASYPTSRWESGYTVRDQYRLQLPSDLPEGEYVLRVGMYVEATGARLPVRGTKRGSGYFDFASVRVGQ